MAAIMLFITFFIGEIDIAMAPLLALCALNFASALAYLLYAGKTSARAVLCETLKNLGVLVIVSTARQFDVALSVYDIPLIDTTGDFSLRNLSIVCFIAFCALNICGNWEKIGLPLPDRVKSILTALRDAAQQLTGRKK